MLTLVCIYTLCFNIEHVVMMHNLPRACIIHFTHGMLPQRITLPDTVPPDTHACWHIKEMIKREHGNN